MLRKAHPAFRLHPADLSFGAVASFLAGSFAAGEGWRFFGIALAATSLTAAAILIDRLHWREYSVFAAALLFGIFYYHLFFSIKTAVSRLPVGKQSSFEAVVSDEPVPTKYGSIMLRASAREPLRGSVVLFVPPGVDAAAFSYGDLLDVTGTLKAPGRLGESPSLSNPEVSLEATGKGFFLRAWMISAKDFVLEKFRGLLPPDEAALLAGITFGSRAAFSDDLKGAMALSGTTHLVAVSGYNITIVIMAAGSLFGRFLGRRAVFALATAFLVLFMFMVGVQASAMRAALMGFAGLLGRELGERASMRNLIAFTAAAMVSADPSIIAGDVGFVLSFASMIGIVYLRPQIHRTISAVPFAIRDSAATTIAAQLAVMPILIRTFGAFSSTAVLANIMIVGTVPMVMFLGATLAVSAFVSGLFAFFIAKLAGLILDYELLVIRLFAHAAVPVPLGFVSDVSVWFYYLLIGIMVFAGGGKKAEPVFGGEPRS